MTKPEIYNHILTVTSTLIAEKGFEKTAISDIVKASGISKGGIYWHFKNRDEIILAIVENIFTQQMEFLNVVMSQEGDATQRFDHLIGLIVASLEQVDEQMPSPIEIYAFAMRKPEIMAQMKTYYRRYQTHLADLIKEIVQENGTQVDDAQQAALIFMSTVEGILLMAVVTETADTLSSTLHQAKQIFLNGIKQEN